MEEWGGKEEGSEGGRDAVPALAQVKVCERATRELWGDDVPKHARARTRPRCPERMPVCSQVSMRHTLMDESPTAARSMPSCTCKRASDGRDRDPHEDQEHGMTSRVSPACSARKCALCRYAWIGSRAASALPTCVHQGTWHVQRCEQGALPRAPIQSPWYLSSRRICTRPPDPTV